MKRIFLMSFFVALSMLPLPAGNDVIPVMPMVSNSMPLPTTALRSLGNKVTTMAVESGFGALSSPVVLTVAVNVLDKAMTSTAPAMFVTELEVFFYVADVEEQVILAEKSVVVKGVDKSEDKAITSAINRINPRTPEMREFTQWARKKVLEYYEQRVPVLMKKANLHAERKEYADALLVLSYIPEGISQWNEAAELASEIYIRMVDMEAAELLHKADVAISRNDYESALDYISKISPQSNRFVEAKKMIADIKAENDQLAVLRRQIEEMAAEKEAIEKDNAKVRQAILDYTESQREVIIQNNASVEEKMAGWLLGKLGDMHKV